MMIIQKNKNKQQPKLLFIRHMIIFMHILFVEKALNIFIGLLFETKKFCWRMVFFVSYIK